MGLDIIGTTGNKHYRGGYSQLHWVRRLALIVCGFPEDLSGIWPTCYIIPSDIKAEQLNSVVQSLQVAGHHFPNLLLHQDCDGKYTRRGKVDTATWSTGNSVGLLKELELLKARLPDRLKTGAPWETFTMLYELVRDEVENGSGLLKFR